jgi:HK97 family phage prohead protease
MRREQRITADGVEVRGGADGAGPVIAGYAAVFNSPSEDLGGFRETIRPGAFRKTIKEGDIRALWNHDANYVLGRKSAGTLTLREDDHGLAFEVTPPDTQWARDLLTSIERRDVTQMSFAFSAIRDKWAQGDGAQTRELLEVRLFEVSPVTFPAYPATEANLRSLIARGFDPDELIDLTPDQITAVLAEARRFRGPEPEGDQPDHSGDQTPEPDRVHSDHQARARLLVLRQKPNYGGTTR